MNSVYYNLPGVCMVQGLIVGLPIEFELCAVCKCSELLNNALIINTLFSVVLCAAIKIIS